MCGPRRKNPPNFFGVGVGGQLPKRRHPGAYGLLFISTFKIESKISHFSLPLNKRSPIEFSGPQISSQ